MALDITAEKHRRTVYQGSSYGGVFTLRNGDGSAWTTPALDGVGGAFALRLHYAGQTVEIANADAYVTALAANRYEVEIPASVLSVLRHPSTVTGVLLWTPSGEEPVALSVHTLDLRTS